MGAVTKGGGRALALLVAVLAFTTAALLRGEVEGVRLLVAGGAFAAVGASASGLLALLSPTEPSWVKLLLFAQLLSLPFLAATAFLGSGALLGLALFAGALSLAALVRPTRRAPLGRAQMAACALEVALFAGAVLFVLSDAGLTARASSVGATTHAVLADAWLQHGPAPGGGLRQPWLAGGAAELRPTGALLLAGVSTLLGVGPLLAGGLVVAFAAALLVQIGYLTAAAVGRSVTTEGGEPRPAAGVRDLAASVFAPVLAALVLGRELAFDPTVAAGLVLAAGACLAALHAARSGVRPWPLLAFLLAAASGLFVPSLGVASAALAAALASGHGRHVLAAALALGALPGLALARASAHATLSVHPDGFAADLRALVALAVLAGLPWLLRVLHARLGRGVFVALAGTSVLALAVSAVLVARPGLLALSASRAVVEEVDGRLRLRGSTPTLRALGAGFDAIRASELSGRDDVALVRWTVGGATEGTVPPPLTPLLTGIPLYWTRVAAPGSPPGDPTRWGTPALDRGAVVEALLGVRSGWAARHSQVLSGAVRAGRTLVVVVTDADRTRTAGRSADRRGPDLILDHMGARVLYTGDGVEVRVLEP